MLRMKTVRRLMLPCVVAVFAQVSHASVNDRLYQFGENEGGSIGSDIAQTNDDAGVPASGTLLPSFIAFAIQQTRTSIPLE